MAWEHESAFPGMTAMGLGRVKTLWRKDARSTARRVHGAALEKSCFTAFRLANARTLAAEPRWAAEYLERA